MNPPKPILRTSKQYRAVYEHGRKFSTPYFSAFLMPTNTGMQRLGITTTRKIGSAVLRNRCRRRLREIFRLRDKSLLDFVGFDLVLNVKPAVATADFQEIKNALHQTLSRYHHLISQMRGLEREQ